MGSYHAVSGTGLCQSSGCCALCMVRSWKQKGHTVSGHYGTLGWIREPLGVLRTHRRIRSCSAAWSGMSRGP